jgi:hypothetical protein
MPPFLMLAADDGWWFICILKEEERERKNPPGNICLRLEIETLKRDARQINVPAEMDEWTEGS